MQYALPLENPPLLVVSDRLRIQIHTHFTGRPSERHEFANEDLRDRKNLAILRSVFLEPNRFKPEKDSQALTAELATSFAKIADTLRKRGESPFETAHFLTQCVFCCFAEDAGVLASPIFKQILRANQDPIKLQKRLTTLFKTMRTGGDFGAEEIPWINGGLFAMVDVPLLREPEVQVLAAAAESDWQAIDPSIFGTLFERGLDPAKRSQLGAHHTDAETIERLIAPAIRRPLLEEWDEIKRQIAGLMSSRDYMNVRAKGVPSKGTRLQARHAAIKSQASRANRRAKDLFDGFLERLKGFRVLDPACGSGNFLYLALKALKDVELQANLDVEELGLQRQFPVTGPQNVLGIEINEYAAELARATIWIGELQWLCAHGYGWKTNPVLPPLEQIECRDAMLNQNGSLADWPKADVVVGNPPFVGDKKMRSELGDQYTEKLRQQFKGRVPSGADLVCYWYERARAQIEAHCLRTAGLVATQAIRSGFNVRVLDRVIATTPIFCAWSDEQWINEGASVRVSLICFGASNASPILNGVEVEFIRSDLAAGSAIAASSLPSPDQSNREVAFRGITRNGAFDIDGQTARRWLVTPNAAGCANAGVTRPLLNGMDFTNRPTDRWVVDFGCEMPLGDAALYEKPFAYIEEHVRPERSTNRRLVYRDHWWRFAEARPAMRQAMRGLHRFIATPMVSKHRIFVFVPVVAIPDQRLITIAREDDCTFGILSSRIHTIWALRWGGVHGDGVEGGRPVYNVAACFETFPFPSGLTPVDSSQIGAQRTDGGALIPAGLNPSSRKHADAIARTAKRLTDLRDAWLNPPEWTEQVPEIVPLGMDRSPYPDRIVPITGFEKDVAKRTLTNLYNERPAWLRKSHETLDTTAALAYGWSDYSPQMADDEILRRLLMINRQRAEEEPRSGAKRSAVDASKQSSS
jgi:hypothetical protein